jgi:hypothetical protein
MKKLIVIAIIAMMITGLSVAANAVVGTVLNMQVNYAGGSWQPIQMGWYSDNGAVTPAPTVNGFDTKDATSDLSINDGVMKMWIKALSGQTAGDLIGDFRAPDVTAYPSQLTTKVWRLSVTIPSNNEHLAAAYGLTAWFTPGLLPTGQDFYIFAATSDTVPSLTDMKAAAIAGTGSGLVTKLSRTITAGSEYNSSISFTLPAPTSSSSFDEETEETIISWGQSTTQYFAIYAQGGPIETVPEPGSMVALFSGLVGLVGFGIRRRK